jgi:hypothetical protein
VLRHWARCGPDCLSPSDVSRGSIRSAIPIGYDQRDTDEGYQSPNAASSKGDRSPSGSLSSPGYSYREQRRDSTSDSRRLTRDLNGMVSSPEGAQQAFQILAGTERSFQDIDPQQRRYSSGTSVKRNTEMCDRDDSRMLQQPHESNADITNVIRGGKALRANDKMLDDVRHARTTHHVP